MGRFASANAWEIPSTKFAELVLTNIFNIPNIQIPLDKFLKAHLPRKKERPFKNICDQN